MPDTEPTPEAQLAQDLVRMVRAMREFAATGRDTAWLDLHRLVPRVADGLTQLHESQQQESPP
jgi:hypothetical protein